MRALPPALAAALASGAATLCTAWILTRRDGVRLGFTDHDRPLSVEGVACEAASGWTAGAADAELGTAPGTATTTGALDSAALTEADIAAGFYDGATVEAWRVDWSAPEVRVLLWRGTVARLSRQGLGFTAEIEGPLAALKRVAGRSYGRACDAALGDARCRADVSGPGFNGAGGVVAAEGRRLTVSGLGGFTPDLFSNGQLAWTSGGNAGTQARVSAHQVGATGVVLSLERTAAQPVAPGDAFTVRAGCDKRTSTCAGRFANLINFQGFPDIPGDDFLAAVPTVGGRNDGASRR